MNINSSSVVFEQQNTLHFRILEVRFVDFPPTIKACYDKPTASHRNPSRNACDTMNKRYVPWKKGHKY